LYSRIWNNTDFSWTPVSGTTCITIDAGRPMDYCVSSIYSFIIGNNHNPICNIVADQHNMFITRPWKEVPQMVALVASPSLPVVFLSSLLWLT
jgi:hypothetical protein